MHVSTGISELTFGWYKAMMTIFNFSASKLRQNKVLNELNKLSFRNHVSHWNYIYDKTLLEILPELQFVLKLA